MTFGYGVSSLDSDKLQIYATSLMERTLVEVLHHEFAAFGSVRTIPAALDLLRTLSRHENPVLDARTLKHQWFMTRCMPRLLKRFGLKQVDILGSDRPVLQPAEYREFFVRYLYERGTGDDQVPSSNVFSVDETNLTLDHDAMQMVLLPKVAVVNRCNHVIDTELKTLVETVSAGGKLLEPFLHMTPIDALSHSSRRFKDPVRNTLISLDAEG